MRSRIAVLASGGGSNLQAILEHFGWLGDRRGGDVVVVVSDRPNAGALERAARAEIATSVLATDKRPDGASLDELVVAHEIDLIVLGTTTPDIIFPSTACLVQHRLGANGCAAFDVNAACSGFVYALGVANAFMRSGQSKKALVIGAETLTRMVDWTERETCVLFGDGAGAVVLEASDEPGIFTTRMRADGGFKHLLFNPVGVSAGFTDEPNHGVRINMLGREVFKVAVKTLDSLVGETLEDAGMKEEEIDWLIPHQANLRIIEATAKRLNMSMDRVIVTVDKHANTSSGSVPLALDYAVRSGKVQRGQNLLLEAFGGGFTWASALLRY